MNCPLGPTMQISFSISELQTHRWSCSSKAPPLLSTQASHGRMLQVNLTFQSCNPTEMYPSKSCKQCISSENKTQRQPLDMCATHTPPKYQNCHHTSVSLKAHCLPVILFRYCRMLFFGIFLSSGSGEFSNPTQIHTGWGLYKYSFSASTWQEAKKWPVWLFEPKKKKLWRWTQLSSGRWRWILNRYVIFLIDHWR